MLDRILRAFIDPTPRELFSSFSDEEWFQTLLLSVKEPFQRAIGLPGFPPDELQRRTVGSANGDTIREAFSFYSFIRDRCARLNNSLGPTTNILDFGVCWGRIIRCFLRDTDAKYLYGVDINPEFITAAKDARCPATIARIRPLGTLPFPQEMFDLVYAYSVFTHLPEHVQDHWLARIAEVLKPGGLFFATVQPPRLLVQIREQIHVCDPNSTMHQWLRLLRDFLDAHPNLQCSLEDKGSIFLDTRNCEHYGDRVMTEAYVRHHWTKWLQVIDFVDNSSRIGQAIVVLRKAPT